MVQRKKKISKYVTFFFPWGILLKEQDPKFLSLSSNAHPGNAHPGNDIVSPLLLYYCLYEG